MDADGYMTEVPYPVRYHRELSPAVQRMALITTGVAAPGPEAITYLELGCGQALSLVANAAANPTSRFIGVDVNPAAFKMAEGLVAAAGLSNVTLLARSFADLKPADLPPSDVITLHGVWSWINADNRARVRDVVGACLKPGGVLYISYNCLPALAPLIPLRDLLSRRVARQQAPLNARIDAALGYADRLRAAGARFFTSQPAAATRLTDIQSAPRDYLAHEYFNADWAAFYHADIAADFARHGLSYGASATLSENLEQLNFSDEALAVLAEATDPAERETLKDYVVHRAFRTDLFTRGAAALDVQQAMTLVSGTRFALCIRPADFKNTSLTTPLGTIRPPADNYQPLVERLGVQPATMNELSASPDVNRALPEGELFRAILILLAMGVVEPTLPATGDAGRLPGVKRLNQALLQRALTVEAAPALISPITGGGLGMTQLEQVFLAGHLQGQNAAAFAKNWLGARTLDKDGKALRGEELTAELARQADTFARELLPILTYLKIA